MTWRAISARLQNMLMMWRAISARPYPNSPAAAPAADAECDHEERQWECEENEGEANEHAEV
jgi:hypothetical protein